MGTGQGLPDPLGLVTIGIKYSFCSSAVAEGLGAGPVGFFKLLDLRGALLELNSPKSEKVALLLPKESRSSLSSGFCSCNCWNGNVFSGEFFSAPVARDDDEEDVEEDKVELGGLGCEVFARFLSNSLTTCDWWPSLETCRALVRSIIASSYFFPAAKQRALLYSKTVLVKMKSSPRGT